MHFRTSTKRTNNTTYHYGQVVQSYRRDDGMPATHVISSLGRLPLALCQTLQQAFRAYNQGESLLLSSEVAKLLSASTQANLRYLDLAVVIDACEQWKLRGMLDDLAGPSERLLPFSDVVLALVLQRCCEPDSKLGATRWVPTTALPEVIGFEPATFNNTRVHRALEQLHEITGPLQNRLVATYLKEDTRFKALFMDVTDTYFEGIGAPMAELTRTKAEVPNKRCLGIVLLVNEHGFPVRWEVVGGKQKDWTVMSNLLRTIGQVPWMDRTLIVFDRAMGNRSTVAELKRSGLHFLTAAHRDSIKSYTRAIRTSPFDQIELVGTDESYEDDIARVAAIARQANLVEIHEKLFVLDLGVCVPPPEPQKQGGQQDTSVGSRRRRQRGLAHQLQRARDLAEELATSPGLTQDELGRRHGISGSRVGQLLGLLRLTPDVQGRIEEMGVLFPLDEPAVRPLLRLALDAQMAALEAALVAHPTPAQAVAPETPESYESLGPLRMVAYFNPQLFVDTRRRTAAHCVDLQTRFEEINAELAHCKRSRLLAKTYRKFSREVERLGYLDAFDITLEPYTISSSKGLPLTTFRGTLTRKDNTWARRRLYDGFVLLLGHPNLTTMSGVELVNSYRGKDVVEKGFQTIKGTVELRPIFHYRDPKVQAHVTLCMLALLLLRTIQRRLRKANLAMSASTCLASLRTCHLNLRVSPSGDPVYDITQTNELQRRLLEVLELSHIAKEDYLRPRLTPRTTNE